MVKLIKSIKEKKEFSSLPDAFIKEKMDSYFKEHKKLLQTLEKNEYHEKSKEYKQAVKEIRAQLREIYGVFQKANNEKRRKLLLQLDQAKGRGERLKALDKILNSHQSTKERKNYYQEIYKLLFNNNKPTHILDLGCGFNPLTYWWIPGEPKYDCCDLSKEDMELINGFFEKQGIKGKAYACNLLTPEAKKKLSTTKADTILLFKLVDTMESQERNVTKELLTTLFKNTHVKRVIISFPLKSIGGRTFRTGKKENWFTRFLTEKNIGWDQTEVGDEEFYDITK